MRGRPGKGRPRAIFSASESEVLQYRDGAFGVVAGEHRGAEIDGGAHQLGRVLREADAGLAAEFVLNLVELLGRAELAGLPRRPVGAAVGRQDSVEEADVGEIWVDILRGILHKEGRIKAVQRISVAVFFVDVFQHLP